MDPDQTRAQIIEVVESYVRGMCAGDADKLRAAFHERACCIGHFAGGLEWDEREAFIQGVLDAVEVPDTDPYWNLRSVEVIGDMATVQLDDIWLGMHFDDTLTLLRHEGSWVIVSKLFYQRPG